MRLLDKLTQGIEEGGTSKRFRSNWSQEDYDVALDRSISAHQASEVIGCSASVVSKERSEWLWEDRDEAEPPTRDVGLFIKPAPPGHKRCLKCVQVLPVSDFGLDRSRHDNLRDKCRVCEREYKRRRRRLRRLEKEYDGRS